VEVSQRVWLLIFIPPDDVVRVHNANLPEQELRPTHTCKICSQIVHRACVLKNLLTDEAYCSNRYLPAEGTENDIKASINEVSVDSTNNNCVIFIITASESDEGFDVISKGYFITKDQKKNIEVQKKDDEIWNDRKRKVNLEIDNNLKMKMILKLQGIGLKLKDSMKEGLFNAQKFGYIGLAWKCDASHDQVVKVNAVMYFTFNHEQGYEYYLESSIMRKFRLKYGNNITSNIKGFIARMIVNRKCVLAKMTNKRAEN